MAVVPLIVAVGSGFTDNVTALTLAPLPGLVWKMLVHPVPLKVMFVTSKVLLLSAALVRIRVLKVTLPSGLITAITEV